MTANELLQQLIDAERMYKAVLHQVQEQGAELFKAVRNERRLTQRQLAEALGVDFSFISKVENGHLRPGKPVLQRLAAFLTDSDTERIKQMRAATHDGVFHADDVFGAALLRMAYPAIEIERSRDPKVLTAADIRFDVGGRSDPATGDYDHHQREGAGKRANGIPYAAFGLLWNAIGYRLCADAVLHAEVDRTFVQAIDAHDNGVALTTEAIPGVFPVTISHVVSNFNPSWNEDQNYDTRFWDAVALAEQVLRRAVVRAQGVVLAREIVCEAVERADDVRIVVLDRFVPWQEALVEASADALLIVYPSAGTWRVQVVPVTPGQPGARHSLPEAWAGLDGDQLVAATGVADATFCHRGRFIAGAVSREGALALAHVALEEK